MILYNQVYDVGSTTTTESVSISQSYHQVTDFLPQHPGGSKIILQLAGQDATSEYDPVHPPSTLSDSLPSSALLGQIDRSTLPATEKTPSSDPSTSTDSSTENEPPPLDTLLNLDDIEAAATKVISRKAWAYYFSASDDLITKHANNTAYRSILLRPRIFVDCTRVSLATSILAQPVSVPFFVSPAAMARLVHPTGEAGIAAACATYGAAQILSNNASMTPEDVVADAKPGQVFGWQVYVQIDRQKSEKMLARIDRLSAFKFVVLTLDAPVPGKREHDERAKGIGANLPVRSSVQAAEDTGATPPRSDDPAAASSGKTDQQAPEPGSLSSSPTSSSGKNKPEEQGGIGKALFAGTAADLTWTPTLSWLTTHTHLPILLKGVQTHEDAYLALQYSRRFPQVRGIVISNHGGRAMDTAPPPVQVLCEIRKYCPQVFAGLEVYVDGGIRRGTDVVKALALGARGVGIGRAALWGLGAGGVEGVERVLQILKEETETAMRLPGVESVGDLGLRHVNARVLEREVFDGPSGVAALAAVRRKGARL